MDAPQYGKINMVIRRKLAMTLNRHLTQIIPHDIHAIRFWSETGSPE